MKKLNELVALKVSEMIRDTDYNVDFDEEKLLDAFNHLLGQQNNFFKQMQLSYVKEIIANNGRLSLRELLKTLSETNNHKFAGLSLLSKNIYSNRTMLKKLLFAVAVNQESNNAMKQRLNTMPMPYYLH